MTDPFSYEYPWPLAGYEGLEPLGEFAPPSPTCTSGHTPYGWIVSDGWVLQNNPEQVAYAKALHERIRREFPELRIYRFFDHPVGPHPVAMFEVNLFTPAQFGAFIPWLVINRGPLSALVHPNTDAEGEEVRNHTQRATWLGERLPLDLRLLREIDRRAVEQTKNKEEDKVISHNYPSSGEWILLLLLFDIVYVYTDALSTNALTSCGDSFPLYFHYS
ncbi:hypothetical protein T310_6293 [Rasamsonia emersonii CBS 393.64]|uniref:DOPA 4,5-dioxygenase n=1 Tax=Rasamsonia emersonii (strain ATCC 16479 / CBS 393.64 / IMI 116815) TaxID=1408163 RepID=A0A0F4YN91_RASE3|nr:hypothetical protein T310_6293 [Rasamsonia emersonii CBS 393.64]KKA19722.1 hypothetical protein T310_6293 [Rasamsonia emersonii CBS 393.64]